MDFILYLIIGIFAPSASSEKRNITIGFLLNGDKRLEGIAREELDYLSHESSDLKFDFIGTELGKEAIDSTQNICDTLLGNRSYVIITAHPINSTTSIDLISYICAFYKIPVVGLESRKAELSDKNNHASFLRVVPTYTDQAHLWSSLVKHFKWNKVNLVTSDDYSNRLTYIQFTSWAYKEGVMIENSVLFPSEKKNLTSYLSPLATSQSKVIVLAASLEDSIEVYKAAKELGVIGKGHIWLVAEQSMGGIAKQHVPQGAIGLRILHYPLKNYLKDAIRVVTKSIQFLSDHNMLQTEPPGSCDEPGGFWKTGSMLFNVLANTSIHGSTGKVAFNWHGDRTNAKYEVINIRHDRSLLRVGSVVEDELIINQSQIVWPGNETQVPNGIYISNHLKIVTVESQPFVIAKDMHPSGNCSNYNTGKDGKKMNVLCTGHSTKLHKTGDHCCSGFCIDLLNRLKNDLNFTYELYIVEDGNFGSLNRVNGTSIKRWNGMVGDIVEGKADLIVASLTINNERAQYIEFSKPFKYQGITILIKKEEEKDDLVSFLRPFKTELWLLVLLSVHVVAVILYLLDRFSPFGRYRLSQTDKEETALDLSSAMWFSWGVLLNSGIGEGTPRSFSARVLGMVWAGFAMIIVASYTANLAAFLVLDRPQPKVSGIDDPELRNPSNKFKYGTVKDSSVDAYFRRQVELSSMYTFMEEHNVATDEIGIEKVKDGSLGAFIWDSPVLFHETSKDCNLLTVGELFGRSGYGIGMPKGSPWSNKISLAILHFHESGVMEDLESTWISFGSCENNVNQPTTLGLTHMLGVFIMVAVGIGAGIVIVILEVLYYKHKGWRKNQQKVLRRTTEHWQERVMETRRSKILQQQNNNNGHVTNGVANGRLEEANENEESGFDNAGYHPSSNNLQEHAT